MAKTPQHLGALNHADREKDGFPKQHVIVGHMVATLADNPQTKFDSISLAMQVTERAKLTDAQVNSKSSTSQSRLRHDIGWGLQYLCKRGIAKRVARGTYQLDDPKKIPESIPEDHQLHIDEGNRARVKKQADAAALVKASKGLLDREPLATVLLALFDTVSATDRMAQVKAMLSLEQHPDITTKLKNFDFSKFNTIINSVQ